MPHFGFEGENAREKVIAALLDTLSRPRSVLAIVAFVTATLQAMEEIKAGTFWINDPLTDNDAGPFGGIPLLPPDHRRLGHTGPRHDLIRPGPTGGQQHHLSCVELLLRRLFFFLALVEGSDVPLTVSLAVVSDEAKRKFCMEHGAVGVINRSQFDHWGPMPDTKDGKAYGNWAKGARAFGKAIWDILGERRNPRLQGRPLR